VKHLAAKRGLIQEEYRLPLVPVREDTRKRLDEIVGRLESFLQENDIR
jgi:dihydrodipicolinate synthase/N-acetylneuraminate lyase